MFIKADASLENFKVRLLDNHQLPDTYDVFLAGHLFDVVKFTPPSADMAQPPMLDLKDADGNCYQMTFNPYEINNRYELVTQEELDAEAEAEAKGMPVLRVARNSVKTCCGKCHN